MHRTRPLEASFGAPFGGVANIEYKGIWAVSTQLLGEQNSLRTQFVYVLLFMRGAHGPDASIDFPAPRQEEEGRHRFF